MKTYYQVGIMEQKIFDGTAPHSAYRDQRVRTLTFDELDDAVAEFNSQQERIKSVVEFSRRHKATTQIHIIMNISKNGAEYVKPYWFEVTYTDGTIKFWDADEETDV